MIAMARNQTQVKCLEGSYAYHYTTIAKEALRQIPINLKYIELTAQICIRRQIFVSLNWNLMKSE